MDRLLCLICGFLLEERRRRNDDLCNSCRMRPAKSIKYNDDVCIPWHGEFDYNDNPVVSGMLFMPGVRVCGHRDCVNPNHCPLPIEEVI